jgi:hypothetical protein
MAMEKPLLSDPAVYPTEKVLASCLKKANPAFLSLFEYNHANFPELEERWKYYNDGKRWLLSVSRKKKTVFWLSVDKACFRLGFYFSSKHEQLVMGSDIPASMKKQYKSSAGKAFRAITLVVRSKKDVDGYKKVLPLKLLTLQVGRFN